MNIQIHSNNPVNTIGSTIEDNLMNCTGFSIATAFIDSRMIASLKTILRVNSTIKSCVILIGVYSSFNRKKDIEELKRLAAKYNSKLKVHISRAPKFHLKYYAFTWEKEFKCFIGSSNLTHGGMYENQELTISLTGIYPKDTKVINQLKMAFEDELKDSADISNFPLNAYREQKRASKSSVEKQQSSLEDFFNNREAENRTKQLDNKAVFIMITQDISTRTEKTIQDNLPTKDTSEYFVCPSKREVETYIRHRRILCIDRYKNGVYYMTWIEFKRDYNIRTDDGNYIVTYNYLSKEQRMTEKMLNSMELKLNVKIRNKMKFTKLKVLGSLQYRAALELFPINK